MLEIERSFSKISIWLILFFSLPFWPFPYYVQWTFPFLGLETSSHKCCFFLNSKIKMKHSLKLQRNSSSQVISKKIFCADLLKWTVNKVCSGQPEFRKVTQCADWELEKQTRELFPQKKRRRTLSHWSNSEHWRSAFMPGWGIQPLTSLTSPLERLSCNQKCCIAWLGSIVYRIV